MAEYIDLNRDFWEVDPDDKVDLESQRSLRAFGVGDYLSWDDILKRDRIILLAEPGAGKTAELRAAAIRLRDRGEFAFFCKLELLQALDVENTFDVGDSSEFGEWRMSERIAYFFLDSVDEARLTSRLAFEVALRRFSKSVEGRFNRVKVVVSCRVSDWRGSSDLALFARNLPQPNSENRKIIGSEEDQPESGSEPTVGSNDLTEKGVKKTPVIFRLTPLSDSQVAIFVRGCGVADADGFLNAIKAADVEIFAERPKDLLDLIAFWEQNQRLGGHLEMLESNVSRKLEEHDQDRSERRPLSVTMAERGAQLLAAAVTFGRCNLLLLPNNPTKELLHEAVNVSEVLPDWEPDRVQTLLGRAIFEQATYGTLQFHHRTTREFLTAKWLKGLLNDGLSRRSIEGLIFKTQYDHSVVVPFMKPVAAWLAIWDHSVRNRLNDLAPEVLIENGDPSALPLEFKEDLLESFTSHSANSPTTSSFDLSMVRRLADPQLGSKVREIIGRPGINREVQTLLLRMIWQGRISEAADLAIPYAVHDAHDSYTRICGIRAIASAGNATQSQTLVDKLLSTQSDLDQDVLGEVIQLFFPEVISVSELLQIVSLADPPERFSTTNLMQAMKSIVKEIALDDNAEDLLSGLHELLKTEPFVERKHFEISQKYTWLLGCSVMLAKRFIEGNHRFSQDSVSMDIYLDSLTARDHNEAWDLNRKDGDEPFRANSKFRYLLFWHSVNRIRKLEGENPTSWWDVHWIVRDFWLPTISDLGRLFKDLGSRSLTADRHVALTAIFDIYVKSGRPRKLRERMKREVSDNPNLAIGLHALLHPPPMSPETAKWRRQDRAYKKRRENRTRKEEGNREKWRQSIVACPSEIRKVGDPLLGTVFQRTAYLYRWIRDKEDNSSKWGELEWEPLSDEFGVEVAEAFRDGCIAYWRSHDPFKQERWRTDSSVPWSRIIGLTGIAMENSMDSTWSSRISENEALLAARYATTELNGFPNWLEGLAKTHPNVVRAVLEQEVRLELSESPEAVDPNVLSNLRHGWESIGCGINEFILLELSDHEPANGQSFEYALGQVLSGGMDEDLRRQLAELAKERTLSDDGRFVDWLSLLLCVDGQNAVTKLREWIQSAKTESAQELRMIALCLNLNGYRGKMGDFVPDFDTVEVLGDLLPIIYRYLSVDKDNRHQGVYTPDDRDDAAELRSYLLGVLANTPGQVAFDALLKLSDDIDYQFSKDRVLELAMERAASDSEPLPWTESDVVEFTESAEKTPQSEADLFQLALDRLDDIRIDIEDGDNSEAKLLRRADLETEIRNSFANRLRSSSRSRYTVGSEEELADSTRIDISLRAASVSAAIPIELKIADKWTVKQLVERMENQLVGQYMRASRSGIFLLVHNGSKIKWKSGSKFVQFDELVEILQLAGGSLERKHAQIDRLEVVGIDLTIR